MSEVLHVSHAETKRNVEPWRAAGHGMGTKDMLGCERIFLVDSEIQVTGNESGIGHESWYLDSKCNLGKSKKLMTAMNLMFNIESGLEINFFSQEQFCS